MRYNGIIEGTFIDRPNRFIANVLVDGVLERVHVKNTGRCKELLLKGSKVYLEKAVNPERKTAFSLISVYKGSVLINMDSQAPNKVVFDALSSGQLLGLRPELIKREYTFSKSRFDIYFEEGGKKSFIEVKGVTLESQGVAMFPDAPTLRGTKHLRELILAKSCGYDAYVLFLIQMSGPTSFSPNYKTDPLFAKTLLSAQENGVKLLAYDSIVTKDTLSLGKAVNIGIGLL